MHMQCNTVKPLNNGHQWTRDETGSAEMGSVLIFIPVFMLKLKVFILFLHKFKKGKKILAIGET